MRWHNTIITALLGVAAVLSFGQVAGAATTSPIIYAKTVWELPYSEGKSSGGLFAASGEQKWQLTDHPRDREPSVSPDRSTIVFVREGDVYAMAADGSGERQLTSGPEPTSCPRSRRMASSSSSAAPSCKRRATSTRSLSRVRNRARSRPFPGTTAKPLSLLMER